MPDDRLLQIIEKLLHETDLASVSLRVTALQSRRRVRGGGPGETRHEYAQTSDGSRYFDERIGKIHMSSAYCDGEKCASVSYEPGEVDQPSTIMIGPNFSFESMTGFRADPKPLQYYHVGLTPLHEALPAAERLGEGEVIGRACDVFHFKDVGPPGREQSLVYSLDRETSVPLRVAAYSNPGRLRAELPNWTWEARSLDRVGDRHFPKVSLYSSYVVRDAGDGSEAAELDMTQDIRVEEIEFDAAYPRSMFWPPLTPGVKVMDSIEGRVYTVESPQAPAANSDGATAQTREAARQGEPIRVGEPGGTWLAGAGAGLSLAVLAVAFFLWRRAR